MAGRTTQRGYGAEHQAKRAALLEQAYNTACPRCGNKMLRGEDLDLGHTEDLALNPHSKADRIEHASCNREAGGRLGSRRQALAPSRSW